MQIAYILAIIFCSSGLYIVISSSNLFKRLIGLGMFQTSCIVFFVALGKVHNGIIPFNKCMNNESCNMIYSASLPQVLMLTAIVVGFATTSLGIAIAYKIRKSD